MAASRFERVCASVRNLAYDDSETTQEDFKAEKETVLDNLRDLNQRTIAPIDRAYVDLIDCVADSVTRRANIDKRRACVDRELEKLQRALEKLAANAARDAELLALVRSGSSDRVHRAFIVDDDAPVEESDYDEDEDEESSDVCDDVYDVDAADAADAADSVGGDSDDEDVEIYDVYEEATDSSSADEESVDEASVDEAETGAKRQRVH